MRLARNNTSSKNNLYFTDGLRGLAALYVLIGHARAHLWEGFSHGYLLHKSNYSIIEIFLVYFFSLFKFGRVAVIFFFVLSGFLIHLNYRNNKGLNTYLLNRFKRIYPPFIFSILFTFLIDYIGIKMGYKEVKYDLIDSTYKDFFDHFNIQAFIGNLFFLMGTYVPTFGTNAPSWSLKYEFWFYIFYPLCWKSISYSFNITTLIIFTLFLLRTINVDLGLKLFNDIFFMMNIWWLGVILAHIYSNKLNILNYLKYFVIFIIPGVLLDTNLPPIKDFFIGLFFIGLISILLETKQSNIIIIILEKLKPLGDMSYTLYLTHFPLIILMSGWLLTKSSNHSLPKSFNWCICGIISSLIISYFIHFFTEVPFKSKKK